MNPITPKGWRFLALLFMALCVFLVTLNIWSVNRMERIVNDQQLTIEHYRAATGAPAVIDGSYKEYIESLMP